MVAQPDRRERLHDEEYLQDRDSHVIEGVGRTYAPARVVTLAVAIFFGVAGGVALRRTGVDFTDVREPATQVIGMGMSQLLALILAGIGMVSLLVAAIGPAARSWLLVLGSVMLAAGAVVIARPDILDEWLAMTRTTGVAFVVAGGVALATVIATPITWTRRRHVEDVG